MKDGAGTILYVGKAKNIKKRVASYFRPEKFLDEKTLTLLSHLHHIDSITTASETDAFILEQQLIKTHLPPYNIKLRDDKKYPLLKLTEELYPRLLMVRQRADDRARYFGPFTEGNKVRVALKTIRSLFPLRSCKHKKPGKPGNTPCLDYHMHCCLAPCVHPVQKEYQEIADALILFLEGKDDLLEKQLTASMHRLAKAKQYEAAAAVRDRLKAIRAIQRKTLLRSLRVKRSRPDLEEQVLSDVAIGREVRLRALQEALGLGGVPERIEAFDISTLGGQDTVASKVVFVHGAPYKKGYRKYHIRSTGNKPDDTAAIYEVVSRRLSRLNSEPETRPDLILIDGGKGQLSAAMTARRETGHEDIPMIGLAKKEELIFMAGRPEPLRLPGDHPGRLLLQHLRDEAHRFAIGFNRAQRKGFL